MCGARVKWFVAVSFDGDFTDDHADALVFFGQPFEAQAGSGFGQLKMARRQGGGAGEWTA